MQRNVVITGANRGIGLALVKKFLAEDFLVIGTSRNGAITLEQNSENLFVVEMDVSSDESVTSGVERICKHFGKIDILINNAGILVSYGQKLVDLEALNKTLEVNLYGPIRVSQKLLPCIKKGGHIINVSSSMGVLSEGQSNEYCPEYRISKTALNMFTQTFSLVAEEKNIIVSSVCPGWVKTDMGGSDAERDPEDAAIDIYKLAISKPKSGQFWLKGKVRSW